MILDFIAVGAGHASAILTVVLISMIFVNVMLRYLLTKTLAFTFDLSCLLFAVIVVLGAVYTDAKDGHITVDAVVKLMPRKTKTWLLLLMNLASAALVFYVSLSFWGYTVDALVRGTKSPSLLWLVVWPFRATWIIGFGLLGLLLIRRAIRSISGLSRSNDDQ